MKQNEITLIHSDKYETTIYPYYTESTEISGTFLLLHDMAEHCERYHEFAYLLNKAGFDVYLYNERAHGRDKKLEELGSLPEHNSYKKLLLDAVDILSYLTEHKRSEKLYLFGQGFGATLARGVMQISDLVDGVVLCGAPFPSRSKLLLQTHLFSVIHALRGSNYISPWVNRLFTDTKAFRAMSERTRFDWLTQNQEAVGTYISDAYCGFPCTIGFYRNLVRLSSFVSNPLSSIKARKDLPLLFIGGSLDPINNGGDDIIRLMLHYQKIGFSRVDCILYENDRHMLMSEPNREEIIRDFIAFLEGKHPTSAA